MNYYNEHDPKAAAWLRELISAGLIPNGDVDERSITEVQPDELRQYTQCHFFAGIGGWSLALQLAGVPDTVRLWTGSCPCQPFSAAGKGLGDKDERHLWPVFFNLIKECRPNAVFGEQVASAIGKGWLDGVSSDLESEGYACGSIVLGAHSVSAPHIRQRLYWVADSDSGRCEQRDEGIGSVSVVSQSSTDNGLPDSGGWQRIIFSADCDEDGNCPKCRIDYADCECFGPTQDGVEYREFDGIIFGRLADTSSKGCERSQWSRETGTEGTPSGYLSKCREHGWLGDSVMSGCETRNSVAIGNESRSKQSENSGSWSNPIGLANSISERGCSRESRDEDARDAGITGEADRTSGMVNSIEQGLERQHRPTEMELHRGEGSERSTGPTGFWDQYDIIPCRDGKSRRIECQSRELADGISTLVDALRDAGATEEQIEAAINPFPLVKKQLGRTILLKGYGNAIVPQVAAEFIKAFLES